MTGGGTGGIRGVWGNSLLVISGLAGSFIYIYTIGR